MTNEELINKYKDTSVIGNAINDGQVIGIEVNEKNENIYIVKRNGIITLEDWQTAQPKLFFKSSSQTITIKVS